MDHKKLRRAHPFCSIDRTPFVAVTASLCAIVLFALMLTNGLPRFGPSDLPKVNNPLWAPDAYADDAIVVVVTHNNRLFWRQYPISIDEMRHDLRHQLERKPQAQVFLAVDAHTSYANVSTVLAAVRSVGVERVVFLVDQRKTPAASIYPEPDFWDAGELWRRMDSLNRAD